MPTEVPHTHPPNDFDPDKTLFFKRQEQRNRGPVVVIGLLALGSLLLLVWALVSPDKKPAEEVVRATPVSGQATPAPKPMATAGLAVAPTEVSRSMPPASPVPAAFDPAKPVRAALPVTPVPASDADADAPPTVPDANSPLNFDVKDPDNATVRGEVLRRIDLMPGVSAATKDKLYASVDHARGMGRVLTVPFVKGETALRPTDVERLKQQLATPTLRSLLDDPTVVFVVLGYADPKGSDKVNADVSLSRARGVLDALRDKAGIQNVMHAVAMGGSTLFSAQQAEKNRVVEVWAVMP